MILAEVMSDLNCDWRKADNLAIMDNLSVPFSYYITYSLLNI